ncbi:MAG: HAMP domain-containing histidine kinase [Clostridiales bacterium]|nr:HAMP domain-containing histidine kinase [Candidatus Cacconaster stercorequi]
MKKGQIKRWFHSLYWKQFALTAGMVLLTLLLLGVSFYALSYNYTVTEKRGEMRDRANLIAQMSIDYLTAGEDSISEQEDSLRRLADMAAMMTDVDFLICNDQGNVILTSDESLVGRVISIPEEICREVGQGGYEARSTMGIYQQKQFVVGVPMFDRSSNDIGMVIAVMDGTELMEMWRSFIGLFFMTSAIILLIAFVASWLTAIRQIQPIQEMVQATRAYAAGEFDVRMQPSGSDEIGELAASFNDMADSLMETERQRRDFIANISHELKTPMTTIAGYTDGILDGTIPPEKERQYLQIISDESRRLSRLVRRMLDISQIQSQEMKKEEFDLCESMRLALLSMEQKILDRGLDVEADIPDDSVMVLGVNDLITQVIYNLLENAAKYASPESTLYLGLQRNHDKAVVTVRNQGNTIPAQEIPLLFERFHKTDKSRSEDKEGYGLGLYVVKTILSQHKEQITVTSENGVTAFSFTVQTAASALYGDGNGMRG